ncbi:MAG: hypothetical protein HKN31_06270, partial [Pricia sp.]|nr:hypothetical protein [Pricia sp.]
MKRIIRQLQFAIPVLFLCAGIQTANGQLLKKLGKRAEKAAERAVERRVE